MKKDQIQRKLTAILVADVVGYSKMMANDDEATLLALRTHRREVFDPEIRNHNGRIVKLMGDGTLVEFNSIVDAVSCAVAIQQKQSGIDGAIELRIGVNLGDIIVDADDIYGDGVNVASRLEAHAEPGGICIASVVYQSLDNRAKTEFIDTGEHEFKNIDRPIQVFQWSPGAAKDRLIVNKQDLSLPDKPSIAVLPFDNMSGDPEQEYFSDGITDDIITELARYRELFVIARHSSFTYRDATMTPMQIAQELGVQYILHGSVRRSEKRLRVTAQLIDPATGTNLWVERYDRKIVDIFEVQDEITEMIVNTLAGEITRDHHKRSMTKSSDAVNAYGKQMR